jgi:urease gamma subunit
MLGFGDQLRAGRRKVPEMIRQTQVEGTLHDRTKLDTVYEPIESTILIN